MNGEIFFDMTREDYPTYGSSSFLLKRWKKYTIYSKSGSYNRTDNPKENLYATNSIYLYDYVVVSKNWYSSMVYTSSIDDTTPSSIVDQVVPNLWHHRANTFRNSPNAIKNNYSYTYDPISSILYGRPVYDLPVIFNDTDTYFEIVNGYPRNHFTHKRDLFSLYSMTSYGFINRTITSGSYKRNSQTSNTTIGANGLEDGSPPVQSFQVGNVDLVQTDNVINQ